MLLEGKSEDLISEFYSLMDTHSKKQSYERAAIYRDRISALRDIQRSQSSFGYKEARDAIAISSHNGITKVGVTHVNKGWIIGHENWIRSHMYKWVTGRCRITHKDCRLQTGFPINENFFSIINWPNFRVSKIMSCEQYRIIVFSCKYLA